MKCARSFVTGVALVFILPAISQAGNKTAKVVGTKYEFIQISRFDVAQGIDFPPRYQVTFDEDLYRALETVKGIKQVLRDGESLPTGDPVLRITGTITRYDKGNRATRYLVGFGAGATVINAHIKCYDAASKELLFEHDVDGKVVMGIVGGKSEGANDGLAKEIVKDIKRKFL